MITVKHTESGDFIGHSVHEYSNYFTDVIFWGEKSRERRMEHNGIHSNG